jgi:hypothetical protein
MTTNNRLFLISLSFLILLINFFMRKAIATFSFSAYQLFRRMCDPAIEGSPYEADLQRQSKRIRGRQIYADRFTPRRRFGFKI